MLRNLSKVGLMVLIAIGALAWVEPAHAGAAKEEKEKSVPERIAVARNKTSAHPKDRVDNIRALGSLNDANEVRDQRVPNQHLAAVVRLG